MKRALILGLTLAVAASNIITQAEKPTIQQSDTMIPKYSSSSLERTLLSTQEIEATLTQLPGWRYENKRLKKVFDGGSFGNGIAFIIALSYICESIDHHPEIFSVYSKVEIATTSYDVGEQVSSLDVELAQRIETLSAQFTKKL